MAQNKFKNPYSLFCYDRVEQVLEKQAGFAKYLKDYEFYRMRCSTKKLRISRFTKAVIFELGCRSLFPMTASSAEILNAAVCVTMKWPSVPIMEPVTSIGNSERISDLYKSLKLSLSALEARKLEIEENIRNHKVALQALSK